MTVESIQVTPASDGILRYGDAPAAPATNVTASLSVPSITQANLPFSASSYFTGTDVANGTITVVEVADDNLADMGLDFVANVIDENVAVVVGAGTFRLRWTNNTDSTDRRSTNRFSIRIDGPLAVSGDTVAPTKVFGLTASHNGTNISLEWDQSSDPHDGTDPGEGIDLYNIRLSGTLVTTQAAASPGISPAFTAQDIGTLASAGSGTRVGAGGTITSAGFIGENPSVNDSFHAEGIIPFSGDFTRIVKIDGIANAPGNFAKAGIMLRFGLADDDPYVFLQVRSGLGIRAEIRADKAGLRVTYGSGSIISFPCVLRYKKSGTTHTLDYSQDGNTFLNCYTATIANTGSYYLMLAQCSNDASVQTTTTYSEDTLYTGSRVSKSFAHASGGPWTVEAVDLAANVGPVSAPATGELTATGGVFPGTTIRLNPGFIIASSQGEFVSGIEARWQQIFTASPDRKTSYRPPGSGIKGGVLRRLGWRDYYVNHNVRPTDPADHEDANYDFTALDAVFAINAVQNEGALVSIAVGDTGWGTPNTPNWLANATYNGIFDSASSASTTPRWIPCYHRYSGGVATTPPIVDEYVMLHRAIKDHLVATGNIDKVMSVQCGETFVGSGADVPADWNATLFFRGTGMRDQGVAAIWAEAGIPVYRSSVVSTIRQVLWDSDLLNTPGMVGMTHPDVHLDSTATLFSDNRFKDLNGVHQAEFRPLMQATEGSGQNANTYFAPGIANPWGHNGVTVPQIFSHVLWAISGSPKGVNKDSGLGQVGDDPPGLHPVHTVILEFDRSWQPYSPTAAQVREAIDSFGPPGTFAFPHLPAGFAP